jgi:hypothetical protein
MPSKIDSAASDGICGRSSSALGKAQIQLDGAQIQLDYAFIRRKSAAISVRKCRAFLARRRGHQQRG